jgi:hypothetical protein
MLVWDDASGNLVISKGGTGKRAGSAIVEGQNAERVDAVFSATSASPAITCWARDRTRSKATSPRRRTGSTRNPPRSATGCG